MTENRDSETGQFAPSELPTGQAGVEADFNAGIEGLPDFKPMPVEEDRPEPKSDIDAEVEKLRASRAERDTDEIAEVAYLTPAGERVDQSETTSLDRAAKDLGTYHAAQAEVERRVDDATLARHIDEMRAEVIKDPKAVEELGLDAAAIEAAKAAAKEAKADTQEPNAQTSEADPYDGIEGLEPETRAALKQPQVRQFLESNAAETDQAVQAFKAGVNQAHTFGQGAMLAIAPELAQIPVDRWAEAVNILSQTNPARSQQLQQTFANVAALNERQKLVEHYQATQHRQQIDAYRATQDAIIEKTLPLSHAARAEFADDLVKYVAPFGVTRADLVQGIENNPLMSNAAFQMMAYQAVQYDKMLKAAKPHPTRTLPPVTRPGMAQSARNDSDGIASLQKQLATATGFKAARIAAKIQAKQRAG
jgi:hypothetical protein